MGLDKRGGFNRAERKLLRELYEAVMIRRLVRDIASGKVQPNRKAN